MNKRVAMLLAVLVLVVPALAACSRGQAVAPASPVPNPSLNLPQGNLSFTRAGAPAGNPELVLHVQIAATTSAQETGLMNVKKMSDQVGMVFQFSLSTSTPFWMKGTLIPLDIAFWDNTGRIVDAFTMTPCTADPCHIYQPAAVYSSSVEMNSGLLKARGIKIGDTVTLTR